MKVLILRFSSIGDIVLTTPVIRNLKTAPRITEVHYATKQEYEPLLAENPYIDQLHLLNPNQPLLRFIKRLRREKYDLIVDLHANLRTSLIKLLVHGQTRTVQKLNAKKWLLTSFKINLLPNVHIVDRYMDTLASLDITQDELGLDYFIPEKDEVELDWLPDGYQQGYAVVAIGGKYQTKRLPKGRLIELCDRINKPIVLIGGKEDAEVGQQVEAFFRGYDHPTIYDKGLEELGKKAVVFNACGKFNINQSASLVKQASWVFSHDTGMMHIAAAFKKDVFTIWGSTVPEFGMYPYRTKFTIFENKNLNCRPCSKLGYGKCPKGHFKCMNDLKFDFYIPD